MQKIQLRAMLARVESKIEISTNPKFANTALSRTLCRLTLRQVDITFSEDPKVTNTAQSPTPGSVSLRGVVLLGTILSLQAPPCFE